MNKLQQRINELKQREIKLTTNEQKIASPPTTPKPMIVILNVGGITYKTFQSNLTKYSGSRLEIMFSERHRHSLKKDAKRKIFH